MPDDTSSRIIQAAAELISEKGLEGFSIRKIAERAQVNLAAANYHFGSKTGLLQAMIRHHMRPLNEERLRRMDALKASHHPAPVPLRPLLHAMMDPFAEMIMRNGRPDWGKIAMATRILMVGDPSVMRVVEDEMRPVVTRMKTELQRTLPHLSERDLLHRMYFTVATFMGSFGQRERLRFISEGEIDVLDLKEICDRVVDFVAPGFEAEPFVRGEDLAKPDQP